MEPAIAFLLLVAAVVMSGPDKPTSITKSLHDEMGCEFKEIEISKKGGEYSIKAKCK